MDIKFINGVFVLDDTKTLIPRTFRAFLNETYVRITQLNGDTMFLIPDNNITIEGNPARIDEVFHYLLINSSVDGDGVIQNPDGSVDLSNYYTKTQIDTKFNGYVKTSTFYDYVETAPTKEYVTTEIENKISEIVIPSIVGLASEDYVRQSILAIPQVDLSHLATKEQLNLSLNNKADNSQLVGLASESYVNQAIANIPEIDLSEYAKISDIPSIDGLASESYVDDIFSRLGNVDLTVYALKEEIPDISGLASEAYVTQAISNIPEIDLSPYALKEQLDTLASQAFVNESIANIPEIDLSIYATKSEIPSISGLASESYVSDIVSSIVFPEPDLTPYALKTEIPTIPSLEPYALKTEIPTIPNLDIYALKTDIPTYPNLDAYALKVELPNLNPYALKTDIPSLVPYALKSELPDLTPYALKNEIPSIVGLATENYVNQAISNIVFPSTDHLVTQTQLSQAIVNKVNREELENFATESFVRSEIISAQLSGDGSNTIDFDVYVLKDNYELDMGLKADKADLIGLATEDYVTNAINTNKPDLTPYAKTNDVNNALALKADKSEIPSVVGLASEMYVDDAISRIPIPDLTPYAFKSELPDLSPYALTEDLPDLNPYALKTELPDLSPYVLQSTIPDFSQFAKKSEIPSVNGLATEEYVDNALANKADRSEIPSIDGLAKVSDIDDLEFRVYGDLIEYAKTIDVNNALSEKVNISDANDALAQKLNITDANSALATKADISQLESLRVEERGISDAKYLQEATAPKVNLFNTSGLITTQPKIWVGTTISNDGDGWFTVDYSSANFTQPPMVVVTANSTGGVTDTSANNANWACVIKDSVTLTGCRGRVKSADSAGLLAAMVATNKANIIVNVMAIGI